jgi:hypothetical protein
LVREGAASVVVFLGRANGSQKQRILQSNGIYERVLAEENGEGNAGAAPGFRK